ncbi:MAG: glycosyltransferase family 4 protein [Candidatus Gracilibacteria bacterium]|nr:glycosyltransferase family 4 protein [Candidatus Gracilibacteria bacterium]
MKILYFIDAPRPGGATNQLYTLLKYLDRKKFTPLVAFGDFLELGPWIEQLKKLDIATLKTELTEFNSFKAVKEFQRLYKSAKPDLIHLHLCHSGSLRAAFLARHARKIKIITTEHDPFPLSFIKKQVKKFTLKSVDHTIAISEATRNFLSEEYGIKGSKLTRIYNGIDTDVYHEGTVSRNEVLGLESSDFVVTAVSELHPRKGVKYLIKAFSEIKTQDKKTKLVICGTGEKLIEYQKLVKELDLEDTVRFLGFRKDVPDILRTSDLFVMPSTREAFGLAALEAMATKVPVIASEVGGLKEILTSETGLFVPPKNSKALSESILKLKKDDKQRENLVKKAFERVEREFTAPTMAARTMELYEKVASK